MESINTFTGGMNLDASPSFIGQGEYRYMLNGDIVKGNRGAKGAAVNEDGNITVNIEWPTDLVPPLDPLNPYTSNWIISKGLHNREDLILIYKDTNDTGNIKVDLLKLVTENNYIRIQLIDDLYVGIGAEAKVDAFVNYETPELVKLYFYSKSLDGSSRLKHVNIAADLIAGVLQDGTLQGSYTRVNALISEDIEIVPYGEKKSFVWDDNWGEYEYITGNLRIGKYVYYWRSKANGTYGEWLQITQPIPISSTISKTDTLDQKGEYTTNDTGYINSNTGIHLDITNVSNSSTPVEIEVARAWYSEFRGLPEVSIIYEGTHIDISDISYDDVLSTIDVTSLSLGKVFISPKTHSIKDNTLFLGNIEEGLFDTDFDARAFRFYTDGTALVSGKEGDTIIDSALAWEVQVAALPLTYDLINPFNTNSVALYQYKTDGSTIGGEGINVSYEIKVVEERASIDHPAHNELTVDDSQITVYQLDEVYRFGIEFRDEFLRKSPVKWIGDIRMPKHHEITGQESTSGYVRAMGAKITFVVDVSNYTELQDKSFVIVAAKREGIDRTVLYEGIGTPTAIDAREPGTLFIPPVLSNNPDFDSGYTGRGTIDHMGNSNSETSMLFYNPEVSFNKNPNVTGLQIEFIGYLDTDADNVYYNNAAHAADGPYTSAGESNFNDETVPERIGFTLSAKLKYLTTVADNTSNYSDIEASNLLTQGQSSTLDEIPISNNVYAWTENLIGPTGDYTLEAEGGTVLALKVSGVFTDYLRTTHGGGSNNRVGFFRIKRNVYPYGGGSYEARKATVYVAASSVNITNQLGNTQGIAIAYGDSFVGLFEFQRAVWKYESLATNQKIAETIMFPVVSSINLRLRQDDTYTSLRWSNGAIGQAASEVREEGLYLTEHGAYEVDFSPLYLYNSVYSQVYGDSYSIERDYNKSINSVFDTKVIYSDTKIVGEEIDSFLQFKPNNFNSAHNEFGSINYMQYKNGNVYVFQDAGFSLARINVRVTVPQDDGTAALLGVGTVLDGFTYISDSIGIQKLNEAITSLSYIYFLDNNKKKLYRFAQSLESVSDFKGLSSYLNTVIEENTEFLGEYDNKTTNTYLTLRNEVGGTLFDDITFTVVAKDSTTITLSGDVTKTSFIVGNNYGLVTATTHGEYTFVGIVGGNLVFEYVTDNFFLIGNEVRMDKYIEERESTTIKFNEYLDKFISFMSFIPSLYIKGFKEFYSSQDSALLYRHNAGEKGSYYGEIFPFILSYVVNESPAINKQLDAISIESKMYDKLRDFSGNFDYDEIENKTFNEVNVRGDRTSTEFLPLVLKSAELPTEVIATLPTDNIAPSIYSNIEKNLYDSNGIRVIPYPAYLYNCRFTLNNFNISAPRIHTGQMDNEGRQITERIRGKSFEVKLIYDNIEDMELRLYNVVNYTSTSQNL